LNDLEFQIWFGQNGICRQESVWNISDGTSICNLDITKFPVQEIIFDQVCSNSYMDIFGIFSRECIANIGEILKIQMNGQEIMDTRNRHFGLVQYFHSYISHDFVIFQVENSLIQ